MMGALGKDLSQTEERLPSRLNVLAFSFSRGGAGVAATRLSELVARSIDVQYYAAERSDIRNAVVCNSSRGQAAIHFGVRVVVYFLGGLMKDENPGKRSLNLFSAAVAKKCLREARRSGAMLHLHWINNETLSLWRLGELPKGTILTLHDEWLYCGSEHYAGGVSEYAFVNGYERSSDVKGFNWNRFLWRVKREQLKGRSDLIFTVPSKWMLERAKLSQVLGGHDVRLLPNPINTELFCPVEGCVRSRLRDRLGFDDSHIVFVAGAVKGRESPIKGFDLLLQAARHLFQCGRGKLYDRIRFVFFGGHERGEGEFGGFPAKFLGHLDGPVKLREVYSMADCTMVPSRVESFGQVAAESLACGTPVIAFRTSGLTDIVLDKETGFLARPYCIGSMADCMYQMAALSPNERIALGAEGRRHVGREFSDAVIEEKYKSILADAERVKDG